ncbi:MAG: Rieske (2Fe-2S) protein [Planctomycetales bacterium]|nr:Rieske (2Fe-2S) protein [Planctomycetales bacterium]
MVDKDNMSVEEMLAYCRQADGGEAGAAPEPKASAPAPKPAESGKKPGEMSVEEMLAAARGEGGGGGGDKPAKAKPDAKAAREMSMEEMLAAARGGGGGGGGDKPAKAKPDAKAAREMSMEEMLAAARGGGGGGEKPAPKAKPSAKAAPKAAAKAAEPSGPSGPKDTGSIFGERNPHKPGPKSKAEAAAAGSDEKPAEKKMPVMPARPAYATPQPAATAEHRRSFFAAFSGVLVGSSMAVGFASLAVTHLLWTLGLAKFMFPNILIEPPTKFKVGFPGEYAPGQVQTKFKAQFGVWVVRYEYQGEQQIYALKAVCTHLGCTPNWLEGEQKFKCPCHGSGFYKDGVNFEGPAPRPLERYAIRVSDDGQLEVDKSQAFNEEKGQWSDPASFVRV